MLFPLGSERALTRPTLVTLVLIALNIGVHMVLEVLKRSSPDTATMIIQEGAAYRIGERPWTLLTSAFLHGGLLHLLGNMLFLWAFGPNVEDRLGRIGFLVFYLGGAAASGALHALIDKTPAIGASGAIAAITGAFLVLFPFTNIKAFVIFFIIGFVRIPALWLIGGQIAWELLLRGMGKADNIARLAHLGGYAYGVAIACLLLWWKILPREPNDLFTISRQAARRREFRELNYKQRKATAQALVPKEVSPEEGRVMETRAAIAGALSRADYPQAAEHFTTLLREHGRPAAKFSRRQLMDLANQCFQSGDYNSAATAYELMIEQYKNDVETPHARLMLGLINARYLNDPIRAKKEILAAEPDLHDREHKQLAKTLLEDLG